MLSLIVILFVALMLPGVINRTRAVLSGRKGVLFYQHINNTVVLFHKGAVYSPVTGFVFRLAPLVCLASMLTAMLIVPVGNFGALLSFSGDVVLFCYLLGLSRVMLILGALDTGSSFEGMGASREALYGALIEPALFLVVGTLALVTGYTSFAAIFSHMDSAHPEMAVVVVLLMYVMMKVIQVESGRIPVDDPRTHLELTMIHEVMVLDYCGFDLGLITLAGWIRTALLAVVASAAVASLFYYNALIIIVLCFALAVVIGVIESFQARGQLSRNTTFIVTISAIAFLLFMICLLMLLNIDIG